LAVEQPPLDVPRTDVIELAPPTEQELCARGAVKLTHIELAEVKLECRGLRTELLAERQRNEGLITHLNSVRTDYQVLLASLRSHKYQEITIRIVELVILALLSYAIDFVKRGDTKNFIVFIVLCLALILLIFLLQWNPRQKEGK
jgi:hypothetical protein